MVGVVLVVIEGCLRRGPRTDASSRRDAATMYTWGGAGQARSERSGLAGWQAGW